MAVGRTRPLLPRRSRRVASPPPRNLVGTVSQGDASCIGEDIYSRPDPAWVSEVVKTWKTPGPRPAKAWVPTAVAIVGVGIVAGILVAALRK